MYFNSKSGGVYNSMAPLSVFLLNQFRFNNNSSIGTLGFSTKVKERVPYNVALHVPQSYTPNPRVCVLETPNPYSQVASDSRVIIAPNIALWEGAGTTLLKLVAD